MRRLIWILLALPVLLLAAAFILPALIDWTSQRARIETAVEEVSGLALEVEGGIALRLLPQPSLRLQEVVWSDPAGTIARVPQVDVNLSLGALLQGEARVTALSLVAPEVEPGREALFLSGADSLLAAPLLDRLEEVEVAGAAWQIDGSQRLVVDRLLLERELRGGAASYAFDLLGEAWLRPLSARGRLHGLGNCKGPVTLEAALEGMVQEARFSGQWRCGGAGLEVSGLLAARGPDLAALLALGRERVAGAGPLAFSLDGPLAWQGGSLDLPSMSLGLGQQEAELRLDLEPAGTANLSGEVRMPLLDLDGGEAAELLAVAREAEALLAGRLGHASLGLVIDNWRVRGASGGRSQARLAVADGTARLSEIEVDLPYAGRLALGGDLFLEAGRPSDLSLDLASQDLRALLIWLGVPEASLPAERLRLLTLQGHLSGTADAFRLTDLALSLDALQASGRADWRMGEGGLPDLALALVLDAFNLDAYGGLALGPLASSIASSVNLDLDLSAERVTLAGVSAAGLALSLETGGGELTLESLRLEDLFGSRLQAAGRLGLEGAGLALDLTLAGPLSRLPMLPGLLPTGLAAEQRFDAEMTLEGPLAAPGLAGEARLLGGTLFFSGLLDRESGPRGDWALTLQHPDLAALLALLELPLRPAEGQPAALDLSGLLRFAEGWSLEEIGGSLGPLELLQGSFRADPVKELALSLAEVNLAAWRWAGRDGGGWESLALALATESWPLPLRLTLASSRVLGDGWQVESLEAEADGIAAGQDSLKASGRLAEGAFELDLQRRDAVAELHVVASAFPLGPFLPELPEIARPGGALDGEARLRWRLGGLPALLDSLAGEASAAGKVRLDLDEGLDQRVPPARLAQRILQALVGDAASDLARIANLSAGIVGLVQRIAGLDFALSLAAQAEEGRIEIADASLRSQGIVAAAEGWIDLARWQIDAAWALSFEAQGGEPYYRERLTGPLGAPDILRDGLLFRGATPPR